MGRLLITTTSAESVKARQILGLVQTWSIRSRNAFSDIGAGFRSVVGGRQGGQEKAVAIASEEVLQALEQEALKMGADAVVATKITVTSISFSQGNPSIVYHIYGTAVKY